MSRVLLAIDVSYQVYRASAAYSNLISSDATFTGGLYGFLMFFGMVMRETEATDVVLCCDSKPYVRSIEYPDYKQLRKKDADPDLRERFQVSEPMVLELFERCGVPIWKVPGFESDDLMGHIVGRSRGRFSQIYAASNDSDLYQLLWTPRFAVYKDHIRTCTTGSSLLRTLGVTPSEHMLMCALQGTHNDIEGIPGVGPKTALKALKDPALMRKYRDLHGALIERNLKLIKLPHDTFPEDAVMPTVKPFNHRVLYNYLSKLDITCTAPMVQAFESQSKPR